MREPLRLEQLADDAWLVHLGSGIDPAVNADVHRLAARIRAAPPIWLYDLVPAYASLGVFFDPLAVPPAEVKAWLQAHCDGLATPPAQAVPAGVVIDIPVAYGGAYGPDLDESALALGLSATELVARHTAPTYTVAMIGFAPGFPYLSGLDPAIQLPRLDTPRTRVPAGSVAIGGGQTGIYPRESPGGWRILGRTPVALFDPFRANPSALQPGNLVRFRAIDPATFERLAGSAWT